VNDEGIFDERIVMHLGDYGDAISENYGSTVSDGENSGSTIASCESGFDETFDLFRIPGIFPLNTRR
jgi:hypothetical protein